MNIIISGALGAMGRVVSAQAIKNGITVIAGVDCKTSTEFPYPIYTSFNDCPTADVIIDFSHPSVLTSLLEYCKNTKTPAVIATTGMKDEHIAAIKEASALVPLFFTFNMSLGINLLIALAKQATSVLSDTFDIEIIEKHHNQKIDAPSGTAVMIANAISDTVPYDATPVYERHSVRKKREHNEIGIHAIRGGTIVGEHEVIFAGTDEVITISHAAYSKNVFATGAIKAAKFLITAPNGLYDMKSLLG